MKFWEKFTAFSLRMRICKEHVFLFLTTCVILFCKFTLNDFSYSLLYIDYIIDNYTTPQLEDLDSVGCSCCQKSDVDRYCHHMHQRHYEKMMCDYVICNAFQQNKRIIKNILSLDRNEG